MKHDIKLGLSAFIGSILFLTTVMGFSTWKDARELANCREPIYPKVGRYIQYRHIDGCIVKD